VTTGYQTDRLGARPIAAMIRPDSDAGSPRKGDSSVAFASNASALSGTAAKTGGRREALRLRERCATGP
jgi:hypothetical protein